MLLLPGKHTGAVQCLQILAIHKYTPPVFLFPVTTNAADITALMNPRMDAVYIGSAPVSSLTTLNDQLNKLFEVAQ